MLQFHFGFAICIKLVFLTGIIDFRFNWNWYQRNFCLWPFLTSYLLWDHFKEQNKGHGTMFLVYCSCMGSVLLLCSFLPIKHPTGTLKGWCIKYLVISLSFALLYIVYNVICVITSHSFPEINIAEIIEKYWPELN